MSDFSRLFEQWMPLPEEEVEQALKTGVVAVDTNILLALYRYQPKHVEDWLRVFSELGDRFWLPHQVGLEFWRNRDSLAANPADSLSARKDISDSVKDIQKRFRTWIYRTSVNQTPEQTEKVTGVQEAVQALIDDIDAAVVRHHERFSWDPGKDEVAVGLKKLFSEGATIGPPFTREELQGEHSRADTRFKNKIPPGFMDDSNDENAKAKGSGKDSDSKYGDYLLWRQLLNHAKSIEAPPGGRKFVTLVTDDVKDDWWRKYSAHREGDDKDAPHRVPHPDLVEEMQRESGARYIQLETKHFLYYARKFLNVKLGDDFIASAEVLSGSEQKAPPRIGTPLQYVRWGETLARGEVLEDGQTFRVYADSLARLRMTDSTPSNVKALSRELQDEGILVPHGDVGGHERLRFTEDYDFNSPSLAASIVVGASASGSVTWGTGDRKWSLGDLNEQGAGDDAE